MPLTGARSLRLPRRNQTPMVTDRTSGMVSLSNVMPLSSSCLRIMGCLRSDRAGDAGVGAGRLAEPLS